MFVNVSSRDAGNSHHSSVKSDNNSVAYPSRTVVHPKLEMTEPGDADEREADAAAHDVMSGKVFRKFSGGGAGGGMVVSSQMESQLNQLQGGGQTMPDGLRGMMERGFDRDFSQVRLHTDGEAAGLSDSIHAKAFTHGNDIYFNQGQYAPETSEGQRLVAHELAHVAQGGGKVGRDPQDQETSSRKFDPEEFCNYEKLKDANAYDLLEVTLPKLSLEDREKLVLYMNNKGMLKNMPMSYSSSYMSEDLMIDLLIYFTKKSVIDKNGKPVTPRTIVHLITCFEAGYSQAIGRYIDTRGGTDWEMEMASYVYVNFPWLNFSHIGYVRNKLQGKIEYHFKNDPYLIYDAQLNTGRVITAAHIGPMRLKINLDNLNKITHGGIATMLMTAGYHIYKAVKDEELDPVEFNKLLSLGNVVDDFLGNRSDMMKMRSDINSVEPSSNSRPSIYGR